MAKNVLHILFFLGGGEAKNPKKISTISRHLTTLIFSYFPGWVGGWVGEIKNKANLSPAELPAEFPAELELGLRLAIRKLNLVL